MYMHVAEIDGGTPQPFIPPILVPLFPFLVQLKRLDSGNAAASIHRAASREAVADKRILYDFISSCLKILYKFVIVM